MTFAEAVSYTHLSRGDQEKYRRTTARYSKKCVPVIISELKKKRWERCIASMGNTLKGINMHKVVSTIINVFIVKFGLFFNTPRICCSYGQQSRTRQQLGDRRQRLLLSDTNKRSSISLQHPAVCQKWCATSEPTWRLSLIHI